MAKRKSAQKFLEFALSRDTVWRAFHCVNKSTEDSPAMTTNGRDLVLADWDNDYEVGKTAYKAYRIPYGEYPYLYVLPTSDKKITVATEVLLWAVKTALVFSESHLHLAIAGNTLTVRGSGEHGYVETLCEVQQTNCDNVQVEVNAKAFKHVLSYLLHNDYTTIIITADAIIVGEENDRQAVINTIDLNFEYSIAVLNEFSHADTMNLVSYRKMVKSKRTAKKYHRVNAVLERPNKKPVLKNVHRIEEHREYTGRLYDSYDYKFLVDRNNKWAGYTIPVERYHIKNQ